MSERDGCRRVGVREIRQNLSVYLDRVKDGESLEVTERGLPVARLVPTSPADPWEQMVADGRITPRSGSLADLPPLPQVPSGVKPLSETLVEQRDEEWS